MEIERCKIDGMEYAVRFPEGYREGQKYPVLILLHGAGTRWESLDTLLARDYVTAIEKHGLSLITVTPLCSAETWFDLFSSLKGMVKEVVAKRYADAKRVYLMGMSMGGYGTWQLAMSMPEYFAAIVPICGGGMYWDAARLINVPVWAFHGGKDTSVFPEESQKMVQAVTACGGDAKLTIYPENGHDAWTDTVNDRAVFEWLLSHENENEAALQNVYEKNDIYG